MKVKNGKKEHTKVCFITSWFPSKMNPDCTPFVPTLVRRLHKAGLQICLITPSAGGEPTLGFDSKGVRYSIPVYRINRRFPFFQMLRLFAKLKPDIVHVYAPNFFSGFAVGVGKILRIPTLATVNRVEVMPTKNPLIHLARRVVLGLSDQIVAVSETVRRLTVNCGACEGKTSVIWNTADEEKFKPRSREDARKLLNLPLEKDVLLFVGRLVPVKRVHYLVHAMPFVLEKRESILVVAGDGPERNRLGRLARKLNLGLRVLFVGHVDAERLALYYNAADVFVLPSFIEGHSVAMLEAMASGLPIVATKVGGTKESVIDGVNGFLVCCGDGLGLTKAIVGILGDQKKKQEFSKMSLKSYLSKFSERHQVQKYVSEYRKLLVNQYFSP